MHHILFSPHVAWWAGWSVNTTNDIAVILDDKKNTSHNYDQEIIDLEKSIKNTQTVIIQYTALRVEYQSLYNTKRQTIRDLQVEYKQIIWDNMTDQQKQDFEEEKKREAEMWQHIFSGMWFDQDGMRWKFTTEEEFFQNHQQQEKKKSDANYVKKNMEEVKWELVDDIKDLSLKSIYRKISLLLHPDRLSQNNQVIPYEDYLKYLNKVYLKVIDAREKEDKATMIMLIQQAGISYRDNKFVLASYADFKDTIAQENKKTLIQELQGRLQALKTSYIYAFYLKHTQGETRKELRDLDDKIQELEDLIASYKQSDEQSNPIK